MDRLNLPYWRRMRVHAEASARVGPKQSLLKGLKENRLFSFLRINSKRKFPNWNKVACHGPIRTAPLNRQSQSRFTAPRVGAVRQTEFAAVCFRNLTAEHESNAGATRFGRKERNKQIGGIWQAQAIVQNPNIKLRALPRPANPHGAPCFLRGIRRVSNQIDQQLLQLVRIRRDYNFRAFRDADFHASLEFHCPADPLRHIHRQQFWLRQSRQMRVRRHESRQRLGARPNNPETLPQVVQERRRRFASQFRRLCGTNESALEPLRHRLNGSEGVIQFVAQNADQSLPRLAFFISQRAAQVAQDYKMVRQAALPEGPAPQSPAPGTARKIQLHGARRIPVQAGAESQLFRRKTQETLHRPSQQALAGAINEAQLRVVVERKDGEVDFFHHGAQQRAGFQRAQALLPQRLAERVHFNDHFAHGVVAARAARPQRKILFAQGRQQIRKCLQGEDHPGAQREGESQPKRNDKKSQRPKRAGRKISRPQQNERNQRTRKACSQREELDAALI